MYEHCFLGLGEEIQQRLVTSYTPLIGFSGEQVQPLGEQVRSQLGNRRVPTNGGTHLSSYQITIQVQRYNWQARNQCILRSGFHNPCHDENPNKGRDQHYIPYASTSMGRDGRAKRSQGTRWTCYHQSHYPGQPVNIGKNLTKEGKRKLVSLQRQSIDVFAWAPSDMTGVPLHIAEHSLQIPQDTPLWFKKEEAWLRRGVWP